MSQDDLPPGRIDYAKQAELALDMARRASSAEERAAFERIAQLWRQLAERQDRSGA